jgi:putative selenate reductase molybdopterin-binding subunit
MTEFNVVGKSVAKVDALPLALGKPLFADDIEPKGMLYAKILWSSFPHARIRNIDISKAEALPGVHTVLCYKNVPRVIHTDAGQTWPEASPYDIVLFDNKVRYVGDRVAAVAADTEEIATQAIKLIKVEYELLPAILDPEKAMDDGAAVIHDEPDCRYLIPVFYDPKHNHSAHIDLNVGDVEEGIKEADFTFEHKFKTQHEAHCAIEPHACICYFEPDGRLVIYTSTQVPFLARRIVANCLQIPERMIRIIKPRIGGGFGGKQEVVIDHVCAALALKTKRPVRLVLTREEVFVSSRVRHPMVMWAKTGVKKNGTISAIYLKILSNAGAYGAHGMTVLSNTCAKALPLYRCKNIRWIGDVVYTNLLRGGAYRGYGATNGSFAMGVMMDEMAEAIGMDPVEFWMMNTIKEGETSPIFTALSETGRGVEMIVKSCSLPKCIEKGAEIFGWKEKREQYKQQPDEHIKYGVGMSCMVQGGTVPLLDMASAYAKMNEDGSFNLLLGAADVGAGADTVLAQIFAETLDIPIDDVIVRSGDTDVAPYDKGAYASSTTYLSGLGVLRTAEKIRAQIIDVAAEMLNEPKDNLLIKKKAVVSNKSSKRVEFGQIAKYSLYTRNQFQIGAIGSDFSRAPPQTYAAHFAEVAVDTETGQAKVISYVAAVDCGTAINPKLAEGQAEGAIVNGISYALTEQFFFDGKGKVLNPSFGHYKIFSALDMPKLKVVLIPSFEPSGPYGAKTVGEVNINGPLPAISNAIYNAVGVRLYESPYTPERIRKILKEK